MILKFHVTFTIFLGSPWKTNLNLMVFCYFPMYMLLAKFNQRCLASKYSLFLPHHAYIHTQFCYTNIAWGSTSKPEKTTSGWVRIYILDSQDTKASLMHFQWVSRKSSGFHKLTQVCSFLMQLLNLSFFYTATNFFQNFVLYRLKKLLLCEKVLEQVHFVNFL